MNPIQPVIATSPKSSEVSPKTSKEKSPKSYPKTPKDRSPKTPNSAQKSSCSPRSSPNQGNSPKKQELRRSPRNHEASMLSAMDTANSPALSTPRTLTPGSPAPSRSPTLKAKLQTSSPKATSKDASHHGSPKSGKNTSPRKSPPRHSLRREQPKARYFTFDEKDIRKLAAAEAVEDALILLKLKSAPA